MLTGFLRRTCSGDRPSRQGAHGPAALRQQLDWCIEAFGEGQCDVFLHTWSTLTKAGGYEFHGSSLGPQSDGKAQREPPPATPSQPCVDAIQRVLSDSLAAVSVEAQTSPNRSQLEAERPWGTARENMLNMRAQMEGVARGLELVRRHSAATGVRYDALVRFRADYGDPTDHPINGGIKGTKIRNDVFISRAGWCAVRKRALALTEGTLPQDLRNEFVTCGHPHFLKTDFCQWSVPPEPLTRTVQMLHGDAFERTIYGGDGCAAFLNSSGGAEFVHMRPSFRIPVFSESVLFCAMLAAGVTPSDLVDFGECHCKRHCKVLRPLHGSKTGRPAGGGRGAGAARAAAERRAAKDRLAALA